MLISKLVVTLQNEGGVHLGKRHRTVDDAFFVINLSLSACVQNFHQNQSLIG
jgi:hypothetical protein